MRNLIILLILTSIVLALTGCGKAPISARAASLGACQNLVSTGTWLDSAPPGGGFGQTDTMVLNNICAGTTTYCNEKFTYQIQADNISVSISVTQTNGGPDCLALGTTMCTVNFTTNNTVLQLTCPGHAAMQYIKQ